MKISRYCHPVMKQLTDQQVRYAPRDVRLAQIRQAECLVKEIDPQRLSLPRDLRAGDRLSPGIVIPDLVISGHDAVHDLRASSKTSRTVPTWTYRNGEPSRCDPCRRKSRCRRASYHPRTGGK